MLLNPTKNIHHESTKVRKHEKEKMIEAATELATVMASKTPLGLRMTKEAINVNLDCPGLEAALQMEDRNQMMMAFGLKTSTNGFNDTIKKE